MRDTDAMRSAEIPRGVDRLGLVGRQLFPHALGRDLESPGEPGRDREPERRSTVTIVPDQVGTGSVENTAVAAWMTTNAIAP